MKRYDVTALGELLIDFTENGKSPQGNPLFEANPGGAPCNVLAMLAKLGHRTAFVGKVGNDFLGAQLKSGIEEVGIDSSFPYMDDQIHTTLAFVHTAMDGDRDFSFYRNPGADMMLTKEDVPEKVIQDSIIFHFGTLSMTHDGVREATEKAVCIAEKAGTLISFDPNLRPPLWKSLDDAKDTIETTGAGDTFCGCVLHYICEHGIGDLTKDNLREMLVYANAAASLVTTRKGASRVMPDSKEVEEMLAERRNGAYGKITGAQYG